MMDICDRSKGVRELILEITPSYDYCDGVSPVELDDFTTLDFTGRYVYSLKQGDFGNLPNLRRIDLSGTELSELHVGAFDGLFKLADLNMSDTQLERLPLGVFDSLTDLGVLLVRNAGFGEGVWSRFHPDLFKNQGDLRNLDVRPSTPLQAAPLSFKPLTDLETYNGQLYTRPVAEPENLDYSSGAIFGGAKTRHTVTLTWDAPSGVTGITGYRVLRTSQDIPPLRHIGGGAYDDDLTRFAYEIGQTGANTTFFVDGRDRDLTFTGPGEGASSHEGYAPWFRYYVVAITANGDGFPTNVKADDTSRARSATTAPSAPSLADARCDHLGNLEDDGDYLCLDWSDPDDPTVTGFEISYRPSGTGSWQTIVANTGYVLSLDYSTLPYLGSGESERTSEDLFLIDAFREFGTGHTNSRQFRIRALNAAGQSQWSNTVHPF